MEFLLPSALVGGLLILPLIVLLHMMRDRRQQIPISSLALWRGLQKKRRGVRFRSIPLSLLLLLQLLLALALVLSLSRPASSFSVPFPWQTIYVLDMSSSMRANDLPPLSNVTAATRFEAAQQIINQGLEQMGAQDRFAVIGLTDQPQILLTGKASDKLAARAAVEQLQPGSTGLDLPMALTLANGLIDPAINNRVVVLTDGNFDLPAEERTLLPQVPATLEWRIIASQSPIANQALLHASAQRLPDGRHRLFARLVNYADAAVARTIQVRAGGETIETTSLQLAAHGEQAHVWTVPRTAGTATLEILEADALPADNRAQLWLERTTRHQVLLVSPQPEPLARALHAQSNVELTISESPGSEYDPANFDLLVLENVSLTATAELPPGNLLLVSPVVAEYEHGLRADSNTTAEWLTDLDWSGVYFNRVADMTREKLPEWAIVDLRVRAVENPATGVESTPPLILHGTDTATERRMVIWTFDLGETNLPGRLTFPLLMDSTLDMLLAPLPPATITAGQPLAIDGDFSIELPDGRQLTHLGSSQNIPFTETQQPGLYRIYQDEQLVAGFAVHAGSAFESNLTRNFQPDTVTVTPATATMTLTPEINYNEIWPWFAGLAVMLVVIEGWFAWRT